jgi:hypothetical protein
VPGSSADGRRWDLLADRNGVCVVTASGTVAEARVSTLDTSVVVELWVAGDLPEELRLQLVALAFDHPAVRPARAIVVTAPRGDGVCLEAARRRMVGPVVRAAGSTCLVEGLVAGSLATAGTPVDE